ncbi:MAG: hypothetical protein LBV67_01115 [Streptococcaceae bacterium]|jgi:hypothetical protein|nr:hypothetical protein [Streptococcaceae bacterium]
MGTLIKDKFKAWEKEAQDRFDQLKSNEEELNKIFIELYGLQDELDYKVPDKEVSVSLANEERDIKSLMSYAVGCMFGRYSLDVEGLVYAGGEWDSSKYSTFIPVKTNVLVISDDLYINDSSFDLVNKFEDFISVVYGSDALEENLDYITLGGKLKGTGTSRDKIRKYFLNDFFKDHVKTYKKRPIYWQFDSGKKNGFKALMYLHRYTKDQLGIVRTDYLHEIQKSYESRVSLRTQLIENSDNQKDKNAMNKEINKINDQLKEIQTFDEKLGYLALKRIELDLDDGVVVNYDKLQRDPDTGEKFAILSKGPQEPKK